MREQAPIALACDIDDTLLAVGSRSLDEQSWSTHDLYQLCALIKHERTAWPQHLYFGTATGRSLASQHEREQQNPALAAAAKLMDFSINSVGSAITLASGPIADWPEAPSWHPDRIAGSLAQRPELSLQPDEGQGPYKVSFDVHGIPDQAHADYVQTITSQLRAAEMPAQVLFSGGRFLDILPAGVNKGTALTRTAGALAIEYNHSEPMLKIGAGDSMNDRDLLGAADKAILPGNADTSLKQWAVNNIPPNNLYIAQLDFAGGIIEGYQHFVGSARRYM